MRTALLFLAGMLVGCTMSNGADFYVAADGRDAWSGRSPTAKRDGTDGPFATIQRAQAAARELRRSQPNRSAPIVVQIRGGRYELAEPLMLGPEDSGTSQASTIFAAYEHEIPILSGGRRITGWKRDERGWWSAQIPEVKAGSWSFVQLFVNGQRRYRTRLPREGYCTIADAMPPSERSAGKGFDRFKFKPGDIRADWINLGDVEVLEFHTWTMSRLRIASVDENENVVTFTGNTRNLQSWSAMPQGGRYLVENVKEALGRPGEWYLDRGSGVLTYVPLPGEDMESAEVMAPRLEKLVEFRGDVKEKRWVRHVQFSGLTFSHSNWVTPPEGNSYPQAEVNLGAAISAVGARDCTIENCTISGVGTYAIEFGPGCQNNRVEACDMVNLGAGGVKIGTIALEEDQERLCQRQVIRGNRISGGGRLHPAAVGVWIGHSPHNRIEHNEIADLYYTGISVGWLWGYNSSGAHHNTIAFNLIHDLGQGVLSDMGGIYTLGPASGSVLLNNLIHDVHAFSYGGWGIYFDEGTTDMLAENNIVYRTKTGGFHQHYGKENIVRNNIFAFAATDQIQRTRAEEHRSFTFERNIVYWNSGPLLGSNWSENNYLLNRNIYWRTDGKPIDFAGMDLAKWRAKGQDVDSIVADPQFVNAAKDDFRLKESSPARRMGFVPIDMKEVGPRDERLRRSLRLPPAFPIHAPK